MRLITLSLFAIFAFNFLASFAEAADQNLDLVGQVFPRPGDMGYMCGEVVKVGDLEGNDVVSVRNDNFEVAIKVSGGSVSISDELTRATIAMASGLKYCVRFEARENLTGRFWAASIAKK